VRRAISVKMRSKYETKGRRRTASVGIKCRWNGPSHVATVGNDLAVVLPNSDTSQPPRSPEEAGCRGHDPRGWNGRQLMMVSRPPFQLSSCAAVHIVSPPRDAG
jgi:hypothetical protein